METGESGVNGAHVLRHVNRENRKGLVNVTLQLHSMVERNAKETRAKIKFATKG